MTKAVDHYMVEYLDEQGSVLFASDEPLTLAAAKALASKVSKTHDGGAYVVAFAKGDRLGTFTDIGSIPFFDGREDAGTDGVLA